MSVSKDVSITFIGITPNPVQTQGAYLVQVGATPIVHTWGDWSSSTWGSLASMKW